MRMNEDLINQVEIKEVQVDDEPMNIILPGDDEDEFMIINAENDCMVGVNPTRFDIVNEVEMKEVQVDDEPMNIILPGDDEDEFMIINEKEVQAEHMDEDKEPIESMKRCKRACEDRFAMAIRKPKVEIKVRTPGYSPRNRVRQESCTLPLVSPPIVAHAHDQMKIRTEKCILLGRTRLVFPKVDLGKLG